MTDDATLPFWFPAVRGKKLTAAFDGGRLSSDGGVMLLAEAARNALRALCAGFDDGHRCDLTTMIDPNGKEQAVEGVVWPGLVLVPAEPAAQEKAKPGP